MLDIAGRGAGRQKHRRRPHCDAHPAPRQTGRRHSEIRKALRIHRAHGHVAGGHRRHRRRAAQVRQELHDDGNGRLYLSLPEDQAGRDGRPFRADPAVARMPLPGHGELAALLEGTAAHVVRNPRHFNVFGAHGLPRV